MDENTEQSEPDTFKAIVFGDTQPSNMQEIEWLAHDVVEEVIGKVFLLRGIAIRIQTTINKIFTTPVNEKN